MAICEFFKSIRDKTKISDFNTIKWPKCFDFVAFWSTDPSSLSIPLESPEKMLLARHLALRVSPADSFTNELKGKWQRYWLRCCIRDECNYFFAVFKECDINREDDVVNIMKENYLWEIVNSDEGKNFYKRTIADWFLRRYNWPEAFWLFISIKKKLNIPCLIAIFIFVLNILFLILLTFGNINMSSLHAIKKEFPLLITEYQKEGIMPYKEAPAIKTLIGNAVTGFPLILEFISAILLAVIVVCLAIPTKSKFLFPRMIGAIFIGLLPLITQSNMWTFPLRLNWGQVYMLGFVAYAIALIHLTHECSKAAMLSCRQSLKRAFPVSLYGLLLSLVLSLLVCDVMSYHFIEYDRIFYERVYIGFFGFVYPKVVVFFASVSLIIGIFVQIFWEEKTVTEPL